jgi:ribosomal protein S2
MVFRAKSVSVNPKYQKRLFLLVGRSFHLGKYSSFRHESIRAYLLGVRKNIDYFSSIVIVVHLKAALRFYWLGVSDLLIAKVLFFSEHPILSTFITNVIGISKAFLTTRWPAGIIGNWHTKVSVPFINYQLGVSYQLTSSEHNRYFKLLKGFKCLIGKPDLVVFLEFPGSIALKDCWLNGIPSISASDSNSNSTYATYTVPRNYNGVVQCLIFSMFLELLLF